MLDDPEPCRQGAGEGQCTQIIRQCMMGSASCRRPTLTGLAMPMPGADAAFRISIVMQLYAIAISLVPETGVRQARVRRLPEA